MGNVVRFSAVNTKVKAMKGKFLSHEQYCNLVEKKSYLDAVKYLKEETCYASLFSSYNVEEVDIVQFEIILKNSYKNKFYSLMHFFNGDYRKLFNILFMRYVLEDLKVILRCKYIEKRSDEIYPLLFAGGYLNPFDYKKLCEAKDIQAFIDNLKGTDFYKPLHQLVGKVSEEGLFRMETAMDFKYFSSVKKFESKLNVEDKEVLAVAMGTYCDLLNIQWIIRGKLYYGLSPEVLFNYIIYDGFKIRRKNLKSLCYAKDENEIIDQISKSAYRNVFTKSSLLSEIMERNILSYLKRYFASCIKFNNMNLSSIVAYLELYFLEIRDIITIVESIKYRSDDMEVKKFITFDI